MKTQLTNESLEKYSFDAEGNLKFQVNGIEFFTTNQPSFDNNPDCTTYSAALCMKDEDGENEAIGKVEWDIRWLDNEDGEKVLASSILDDESDVCDWDQFTVYIDPYII